MAMAAAGARGELVARGCERLRVGVQSRCALGRRADRRRKRFGASEGGRGGGYPVQRAPSMPAPLSVRSRFGSSSA